MALVDIEHQWTGQRIVPLSSGFPFSDKPFRLTITDYDPLQGGIFKGDGRWDIHQGFSFTIHHARVEGDGRAKKSITFELQYDGNHSPPEVFKGQLEDSDRTLRGKIKLKHPHSYARGTGLYDHYHAKIILQR